MCGKEIPKYSAEDLEKIKSNIRKTKTDSSDSSGREAVNDLLMNKNISTLVMNASSPQNITIKNFKLEDHEFDSDIIYEGSHFAQMEDASEFEIERDDLEIQIKI